MSNQGHFWIDFCFQIRHCHLFTDRFYLSVSNLYLPVELWHVQPCLLGGCSSVQCTSSSSSPTWWTSLTWQLCSFFDFRILQEPWQPSWCLLGALLGFFSGKRARFLHATWGGLVCVLHPCSGSCLFDILLISRSQLECLVGFLSRSMCCICISNIMYLLKTQWTSICQIHLDKTLHLHSRLTQVYL